MRRDQLPELHYITPLTNVRSILEDGILSYNRARLMKPAHESVALEEIQDRRRRKVVPGGRRLHDYANLYIYGRNPMMYRRRNLHGQLCVLRVHPNVLDEPGAVVADRNASRGFARFYRAPTGLGSLVAELVFSEGWQHPENPIEQYRHAGMMCAELLVPDRVVPRHILGAYVSCAASAGYLAGVVPQLSTAVDPLMFFLPAR